MLKKIVKSFLGIFWGRKIFQPFFERLFFFSLRGMNVGGGSFLQDSGETQVIKQIAKNLWQDASKVTIFDVGANKGEYSLSLRDILKTHNFPFKIFAFEPSAAAYQTFKKNAANYGEVTAYNFGLGSAEAKSVLYFDEQSSGMASLYKRDMSYFKIDFNLQEEVAITTLDKFCKESRIEKINYLKLDVEGNEMEVLKGAQDLLKADAVDFIQFEFGGADIDARVFLRDFVNLLKGRFNIFRIVKDGLRPLNYSEFFEIFVTTNFLAASKRLKDFK